MYKILQDDRENTAKEDGVEREDYEIDEANAIPKHIQEQVMVQTSGNDCGRHYAPTRAGISQDKDYSY